MPQDRPLVDVMEAVISLIPEDFKGKENFVESAGKILDSAKYTAPEKIPQLWHRFVSLLGNSLPDPRLSSAPEWAITISQVVGGKKNYKDFLPKDPSGTTAANLSGLAAG